MIARDRPFVLLDDARDPGAGTARLFRDPVGIVSTDRADEVEVALERMRAAVARGLHVAGWIAYEAGAVLEPGLKGHAADADGPLLWFGLFDRCEPIPAAAVPALLPDPAGAWAGPPRPLIDREAHAEALDRVKHWIAAGDIYQANLTFPNHVAVQGDPRALYARLRQAKAGWGGIVFTGDRWLLSCSPELFFTATADGALTARPMKGTAPAGADPASLRDDPKQRAENLMIVDLIRNDLARVAEPGSVAVPALFDIEAYPTVVQMTSTVTARLAERRDAIDVLTATFPCGSITGAPKIRAMEVIAAVEHHPRGSYTGSIGHLSPDGSAAFNVAIRTLDMLDGADDAMLGLGSGIVADSESGAEWRECLAKGRFVTAGQRSFDLIETMRFEPMDGLVELERHLARMRASAAAFGFAFDRHDARNELQAATFRLRAPARVRLMLGPSGALAIEVGPMPETPGGTVGVALVPLPVDPSDFRLRHKTSDRGFYDRARREAGTWDVLFERPDGLLTEGSFTNLFVPRDDRLLTPALDLGLLPGTLRDRLIGEGRAVEAELTRDDLSDGFFMGNALRGLIAARLAA
ncbi:aminodeoxychorismate synthase component I [Sphingomonas sp. 1P06PA]|uniref:aminodeoxychorismate synthase component I n=1 Tax=Sphingomonas sp. 1P06PA TaxID=554121 RepID=UPI0039A5BEDB